MNISGVNSFQRSCRTRRLPSLRENSAVISDKSVTRDVLTIGHAIVDILFPCDDAFLRDFNMQKGSMSLIDNARADQIQSRIGKAQLASGGSAANTAAGVVGCGGQAGFLGAVADDEFGSIYSSDIQSIGVEFFSVSPKRNQQTGRSFILVTPDGQRTMNTNIGISGNVDIGAIEEALLASSRIVYLEGYLFDDSQNLDDWLRLAEIVHRNGNQLALSLSDPFCVGRHKALFLEVLSGSIDMVFGNEDEFCVLHETQDANDAFRKTAQMCDVAIMTMGERGAILQQSDLKHRVFAMPTNVVDTTGAGDQFAAGVLAGVAQGMPLEHAGRLGANAAAAVIAQFGARCDTRITL